MYIALKGNATMLTSYLCLHSPTDRLMTQTCINCSPHATRVGLFGTGSPFGQNCATDDRQTTMVSAKLRLMDVDIKAQFTLNMVPSVLTLTCAGLNKAICQCGLANKRTVSILANIKYSTTERGARTCSEVGRVETVLH